MVRNPLSRDQEMKLFEPCLQSIDSKLTPLTYIQCTVQGIAMVQEMAWCPIMSLLAWQTGIGHLH